jgi:dTDP-4-dehydrorhamnose reductase
MILVLGQGLLGKTISKLYPDTVGIGHADFDICNPEQVYAILDRYRPTYVINCVGVVPKSPTYESTIAVLRVNSLGPKLLSEACFEFNCRLIHVSTDCVFSGSLGNYLDIDIPNPDTLYGMSKYLGELDDKNEHVTLRTSFVGFPDPTQRGLLYWLKHAENPVEGYVNSWWNGLTTVELSHYIMSHLDIVSGLHHVSNKTRINKHDLLVLANEIYGWEREIIPVEDPKLDRTLYSETIDKSYQEMFEEMKEQLGDLDEGLS